MKCTKCGHENAPAKRSCERCFAILEGYTENNVTGEWGYRNADGTFTPDKKEEPSPKSKTCKVVMLPATETIRSEPDGLTYITALHLVGTHKEQELRCDKFSNGTSVPNGQHLYICSSEEIKVGDWYYNPSESLFGNPHVERCEYDHEAKSCLNEPICLKIIASTDPALKLPAIPENFLEDYAKNPINEIEIQHEGDATIRSIVDEPGFSEIANLRSSITGQTFGEYFNSDFFKSMVSEPSPVDTDKKPEPYPPSDTKEYEAYMSAIYDGLPGSIKLLPIAVVTFNKEEYLAMCEIYNASVGIVFNPSPYEDWVEPVIYFRMDKSGFGVTDPNLFREEYRTMTYSEYLEVVTPKSSELRIGLTIGEGKLIAFIDRLGNEMVSMDYEGNFKVYGRPTTDPERIVQAMSKYAAHHKKYFK